jgi:hypothetical protein
MGNIKYIELSDRCLYCSWPSFLGSLVLQYAKAFAQTLPDSLGIGVCQAPTAGLEMV